METLCYALLGGYPIMGAAIAVLWRAYHKAQEDRIRTAKEHESTLETIKEMLKRRVS